MSNEIMRYLPEEVPDHLFTQNRLNRMGLSTTGEHVAYVSYPEQKRDYKLFDINNTKKRQKQKGFSLVVKDLTVEQVLEERKHEHEIRRRQFG